MERENKKDKKRYTSISIDVRLKDKLDNVMWRKKERKSYNMLIADLANEWINEFDERERRNKESGE